MARRGRHKRVLICLIGVEGSGKSTMAKALTTSLQELGMNCQYVYGGFTSSFTVLRPIVTVPKAILLRGDRHYDNSHTKGSVLKSTSVSALYQYLAPADHILQGTFKIRAPIALG